MTVSDLPLPAAVSAFAIPGSAAAAVSCKQRWSRRPWPVRGQLGQPANDHAQPSAAGAAGSVYRVVAGVQHMWDGAIRWAEALCLVLFRAAADDMWRHHSLPGASNAIQSFIAAMEGW